jgi:hypothetical protein
VQQRKAAEAEHEHDLLGGVGDRGQRVGAEHRQREPLRQQRLVELVAWQRLADDGPAEGGGGRGHGLLVAPSRPVAGDLDGTLTARRPILMVR